MARAEAVGARALVNRAEVTLPAGSRSIFRPARGAAPDGDALGAYVLFGSLAVDSTIRADHLRPLHPALVLEARVGSPRAERKMSPDHEPGYRAAQRKHAAGAAEHLDQPQLANEGLRLALEVGLAYEHGAVVHRATMDEIVEYSRVTSTLFVA